MFNMNPETVPLGLFKLQIFEFSNFICYAMCRKVPGKSSPGPGMWSLQAADASLVLRLPFCVSSEFCSC